jgi:hypothetical protein
MMVLIEQKDVTILKMASSQFFDFGSPQIGKKFEIFTDDWAIEVFIKKVEPQSINNAIKSTVLLRVIAHITGDGGSNPVFRCSIIPLELSESADFPKQDRIPYVDVPEEFCLKRIEIREEALRIDKLYRVRKNHEREAEECKNVISQHAHLKALEARIVDADAMIVKMTEVNKAKKLAAMSAGRARARDVRISALKEAKGDRIIKALTKEKEEILMMAAEKDSVIKTLMNQNQMLTIQLETSKARITAFNHNIDALLRDFDEEETF